MWLKAQHFPKRDPVSYLLVTLISNPRDFRSLFLSSSIVDDALWSGGDVFLQARPLLVPVERLLCGSSQQQGSVPAP